MRTRSRRLSLAPSRSATGRDLTPARGGDLRPPPGYRANSNQQTRWPPARTDRSPHHRPGRGTELKPEQLPSDSTPAQSPWPWAERDGRICLPLADNPPSHPAAAKSTALQLAPPGGIAGFAGAVPGQSIGAASPATLDVPAAPITGDRRLRRARGRRWSCRRAPGAVSHPQHPCPTPHRLPDFSRRHRSTLPSRPPRPSPPTPSLSRRPSPVAATPTPALPAPNPAADDTNTAVVAVPASQPPTRWWPAVAHLRGTQPRRHRRRHRPLNSTARSGLAATHNPSQLHHRPAPPTATSPP
jgi:hypothetical protein